MRPEALPRPAVSARRLVSPRALGTLLMHLILILGSILTVVPFLYMISASFKTNSEIYSVPLTWIPKNFITDNYVRLVTELPFIRQYLNSVFLAVVETSLLVFFSSLGGYGFAKYEFWGKRPMFLFLLATMMIPSQLSLVPLFLIVNFFGWINTYWAIIIPGMISAFGIFFMRQVMVSIPNEVIDAARVDGASEFGIYWRIALPMAGAGVAVYATLAFLGSWNSFLWPLIVLRTPEMLTAPVAIASLVGLYKVEYGMIMAGATLSIIPVIILFLLGQKYFIAGILSGAIKG